MPRYKLTIEYDGSPFVGWQMQAEGESVQGAIAEAVTALTGAEVRPQGAGRTDSGVHALGQVAHIDLARDWPVDTLRDALNYHLKPAPVVVLQAERVSDDFNARFSATHRHYEYRLLPRRARPALTLNRVWWVRVSLDADAMHEAAQLLVGHHDFTTYRASACQAKSPMRTLDRLSVNREGNEIVVAASAQSFLHNQVRSLVGSLKLVGDGSWPVARPRQALDARDRRACGAIAPAHGLYLTRVDYPE